MTDRMATVQGRCPACGWTTLFLGDGGHVTCSRLECPNPSAADDLLHTARPSHDGPSVREAAANDARWWGGEKTGE